MYLANPYVTRRKTLVGVPAGILTAGHLAQQAGAIPTDISGVKLMV